MANQEEEVLGGVMTAADEAAAALPATHLAGDGGPYRHCDEGDTGMSWSSLTQTYPDKYLAKSS